MSDHLGHTETSRPKLGPGDTAYVLAWCAWREAEIQTCPGAGEDEARQRFVQWWNNRGGFLLDEYGYRLLDTEATDA